MYDQKFGRTFCTAAQNREKQEWANETPKLDTARKLRGTCFSPIQMTKNVQKLSKPQEENSKDLWLQSCLNVEQKTGFEKVFKTMYGCMVESHESTHEDHIAGKGFISMSQYNLVHKFIPMPRAMKIPDAKAAVDKEWTKLETITAWDSEKPRAKRRLFLEHKEIKRKSTLLFFMDMCHLENAELEPKLQKYKSRVVLRRDIVKDDSGAYAVFSTCLHACKIGGCSEIAQISDIRMSRRLDTSSTTQMAKIFGEN